MADIAMLVAEEYERRIKNSRRIGGGDTEEIDLFSSLCVLGRKLHVQGPPSSSSSSWFNNMEMKVELPHGHCWAMEEPKSQIGVAAISGFFSA